MQMHFTATALSVQTWRSQAVAVLMSNEDIRHFTADLKVVKQNCCSQSPQFLHPQNPRNLFSRFASADDELFANQATAVWHSGESARI